MAWAASLYFLNRALIGDERWAWYGVGASLGLGLLSKYTIVMLGRRRWRSACWIGGARLATSTGTYVAVLIALALFAPVVYWNYANEWASFRFQAGGRFGDTAFSLRGPAEERGVRRDPLRIAVLPLLFVGQWTARRGYCRSSPHARPQRLFVSCFIFVRSRCSHGARSGMCAA